MLFLLNIKFISLVRQNSVTFSLVLRTHENIREFCLTHEINLIFNKTLNILYIYYYKNSNNIFQVLLTPKNNLIKLVSNVSCQL